MTDPEGGQTSTTWDPTCAFVTASTNALGHTSRNSYYGVNAATWRSPRGPFGIFELKGRFGQLAESVDANGAVTRQGYDEWGRLTTTFSPLDRADRPGERFEYADARCSDVFNPGEQPCDTAAFNALITPSRTLTNTWDDAIERYRRTYEFNDGQVQSETLESGRPGWTISGARDFDAQGRVVRTYKMRYLPTAPDAVSDACPAAGTWCDVAGARDPLRAPSLATVQTAYDAQSRVFRTYGPGVPKCPDDPSAVDAAGLPTCDAVVPAGNLGHVTRTEYFEPGRRANERCAWRRDGQPERRTRPPHARRGVRAWIVDAVFGGDARLRSAGPEDDDHRPPGAHVDRPLRRDVARPGHR